MSMFVDEENHYRRYFIAAWPAAGETVDVLAAKIHKLVRRMAVFDPAYGEVRPQLAMRGFRASDPGPVLEMSVEELGSLIDRRGRFDPPPPPAPVGKDGYSIVFCPDRSSDDPHRLGVDVIGGQYRAGAWDRVTLEPHPLSPIWRGTDLALSAMDALIDALDCKCASASGFIAEGVRGFSRPWITWVADDARSLPLPFPFPFADAPPAPQRSAYRDGALSIWP